MSGRGCGGQEASTWAGRLLLSDGGEDGFHRWHTHGGMTSRKAALWAARGDLGHLHSGGRPWPWERLELMCAGAITSVIWSKSPGCAEPASRL